jgi:hypothetical protein
LNPASLTALPITNQRHVEQIEDFCPEEMKLHGAERLEFGTVNEKVDPAVLSGELQALLRHKIVLTDVNYLQGSPKGWYLISISTRNILHFLVWEDSWKVMFNMTMGLAVGVEIQMNARIEVLDGLARASGSFERFAALFSGILRSDFPTLIREGFGFANIRIEFGDNQSLFFDMCCFLAYNQGKVLLRLS